MAPSKNRLASAFLNFFYRLQIWIPLKRLGFWRFYRLQLPILIKWLSLRFRLPLKRPGSQLTGSGSLTLIKTRQNSLKSGLKFTQNLWLMLILNAKVKIFNKILEAYNFVDRVQLFFHICLFRFHNFGVNFFGILFLTYDL